MITPYVAAIVQTDSRHRHAPATPAPTSKPTNAPAPVPSPIQVSSIAACVATITNGKPLPLCVGTSFFPQVTPSDVYRRVILANPIVDPNSSLMIASNFGTKAGNALDDISGIVWFNGKANYLYSSGRPLYVAKTTDMLVTLKCTMYCNQGNPVVYVPANMIPEGSSDRHASILQPEGSVVDTWLWGPIIAPFFSGETVNAATVAMSSVDGTKYSANDLQSGFMIDAATVGGMVSNSGTILLSELQSKFIGHELYGLLPCFSSNWDAPATQASDICSGKVGIPLGSLLQYIPSDATISASNMSPVEKTILTAAHDYGIRMDDSAGIPSLGLQVESQDSFWSFGSGSDPFVAFAISAGFNHVTNVNASPPLDEYRWDITDANLPGNWRILANGN